MTRAETIYKGRMAEQPCAICVRLHGEHEGGHVELHHLREGGWGRGDYTTLIPLCITHHRGAEGIHTMGTKAWQRAFNVTQAELLEWARSRVRR